MEFKALALAEPSKAEALDSSVPQIENEWLNAGVPQIEVAL